MKYLVKYLRPYLRQCIVGPAFKLLEAILELTIPVLTARIIDVGIAYGDTAYITKTGLLMLGIIIVSLVSALICQYSAADAAQGFGTRLRSDFFRHVCSLSHAQIDRFGQGTLSTRMTNDINQIQQGVNMMIRLIIRTPFVCIGSAVAAVLIDPALALIIIVSLPIFSLILWLIMRITFRMYSTVQSRLDALSANVGENLSGVRVIRAFARNKAENRRFEVRNGELSDSAAEVGRISAMTGPLTTAVMDIAIIAIVWFGGIRVNVGGMSSGQVFAFITYITQMLTALIVFANLVIIFTKANASVKRVSEVLATVPELDDGELTESESDTAVAFEHVAFSYNGGEPALKDIDFSLEKGQTLGIIGGTGAGKSTLIGLICRFFDASEGRVLVDGADVRDYRMESLRGKIGLCAQKNELFSGTIAENIRWGNPDATDEQVRRAADIAQATEFIEKKPDGFNSRVERGGANFSGGQRQRLTLARAVCREPEILILDDSTSALDFLTESRFRAALQKQAAGTTVIIISQRASAVRRADKILVLDGGEAVGLGKHDELMAQCGIYREIVESQQKNR
jgi:ATP-binding cassette subfamily B multidrug efflux pump